MNRTRIKDHPLMAAAPVLGILAGFLLYPAHAPRESPVAAATIAPADTPAGHGRIRKDEIARTFTVPFIENRGQLDPRVAYYAPIAGGRVFVTHDGRLVYDLHRPGRTDVQDPAHAVRNRQEQAPAGDARWVLVETLAEGVREPRGIQRAATHISSFLGRDESRWRSGLAAYHEVQLDAVYPGIALTLRAHSRSVEKVFTVTPAASPSAIRIQLDGALSLRVDGTQALAVDTGLGRVAFSQPVAWQERNGHRVDVPVSWRLNRDGSYGFQVASYDNGRDLYIDPLIQATYLGGSGDENMDIAEIAGNGDIYLVGVTSSTDFPGTTGGAQTVNQGGSRDVVIAILSPDLGTLRQVTYLGGSGDDYPAFLDAYLSGPDFYVLGNTTSSDFPGTSGGAQATYGGTDQYGFTGDAFVARLDSGLTTLVQSTYFGGGDGDTMGRWAFMPGGDIYISGHTLSADLPGTGGGAQPAYGGGSDYGDAFVALLSADLHTLQQATYFGGSADELGDIQVTPAWQPLHSGSGIYIAGTTTSADLPGTSGGLQAAYAGGSYSGDVFIARLSPDLSGITQATYLGGTSDDFLENVSSAGSASFYVLGTSGSVDFPGTAGGAQPGNGGGPSGYALDDAVIALVSDDLTTLTQATYLGGSGNDYLNRLYDTGAGSLYLSGHTTSSDFPGTAGGAQTVYGGGLTSGDAVIAILSSDLTTLGQSTYYGGNREDNGVATLHGNGQVYLSGNTNSTNLPGVLGGIREIYGGASNPYILGDAYIARFSSDLATLNQATYFGGGGDDNGWLHAGPDARIHDDNGNIYLLGITNTPNLTGVAGGAQPAYGGGVSSGDVFAALITNDLTGDPAVGPVSLSGTIRSTNGTPICAMVLASGQYMFSCNPVGDFALGGLPRQANGTVKLQIYAQGFRPYIANLTQSGTYNIVMAAAGACPNYNATYTPAVNPGAAGQWVTISGQVLLQNSQTPVCAMVLANGQHVFSCGGSGNYSLHIPLDAQGQFKLQVYAQGFAPYTIRLDEFRLTNTVRLARALECQ